jgi:peroxiredoxin
VGPNRAAPKTTATAASPLATGPSGSLELPFFRQSTLFPIDLPPRGQLECEFSADSSPQLQLTFRTPDQRTFSLESWESFWVLHSADSFAEIPPQKTTPPANTVRFRLFWDLPAKTVRILAQDGSSIASLPIAPAAAGKETPGLILTNKGSRLTLNSLHIRANERPTPTLPAQGVLTSAGTPLPGEILTLSAGTLTLRSADTSTDSTLPLDSLDALVFRNEAPPIPRNRTEWIFADGTFLLGEPESIREGRAELRVTGSEIPFAADLHALALLRCRSPRHPDSPAPTAQPDLFTLGESVKLKGRFHADGSPTGAWIPEGSIQPVNPAPGVPHTITLPTNAANPFPQPAALLHTRNGEILSGSLQSLSAGSLRFQADFSEVRDLPTTLVSGLLLAPKTGRPITGFTDPAWQIFKGSPSDVRRDGEKLELSPGSALYLPNAMGLASFEFEIETSRFSFVGLSFFVGSKPPAAPQLQVVMGQSVRFLSSNTPIAGLSDWTTDAGKSVCLRFVPENNAISIFCDGVPAGKFPLRSQPSGSGLLIEPTQAWGNPICPITLSRFRTQITPGSFPTPVVAADAKHHALTVPRLRKDTPPTHALIAPNGDLLTGILETATSTHLRLRSGLETFTLPLDRLQSIVWMSPPNSLPQTTDLRRLTEEKLQRKIDKYQAKGSLEEHLKSLQAVEPTLQFAPLPRPANSTTSMSVQYGVSPRISEILDRVCESFALHYSIAHDGKIHLYAGKAPTIAALQTSVHWLKEAPFSPEEHPEAFFLRKGIRFPSGASLDWEPATRTLRHTNTAENRAQLVKNLEETGDNLLGSPSHGLCLLNGVRIALQIERFERDQIIGRHPIYGKCTIPAALLLEITSSKLHSTQSSQFFNSWHLIPAPEPEISGSAAQSASTLKDKPAPDFKLPLLGGGEFELAKHRGKVVVLDFWASWCGPCVKALPELLSALRSFSADQVTFLGVNQGEAQADLQTFIQKRGWKLTSALDSSQTVGKQFGVEGIPHTVVIGPEGKIVSVHTGYSPESAQEIADTVRSLLPKTPPAPR